MCRSLPHPGVWVWREWSMPPSRPGSPPPGGWDSPPAAPPAPPARTANNASYRGYEDKLTNLNPQLILCHSFATAKNSGLIGIRWCPSYNWYTIGSHCRSDQLDHPDPLNFQIKPDQAQLKGVTWSTQSSTRQIHKHSSSASRWAWLLHPTQLFWHVKNIQVQRSCDADQGRPSRPLMITHMDWSRPVPDCLIRLDQVDWIGSWN